MSLSFRWSGLQSRPYLKCSWACLIKKIKFHTISPDDMQFLPCNWIGIGPSCIQTVAGASGYFKNKWVKFSAKLWGWQTSGGLSTIFTPPSPYVSEAYCWILDHPGTITISEIFILSLFCRCAYVFSLGLALAGCSLTLLLRILMGRFWYSTSPRVCAGWHD